MKILRALTYSCGAGIGILSIATDELLRGLTWMAVAFLVCEMMYEMECYFEEDKDEE